MVRRGHEIGSHSATHPLLPQVTDGQLEDELRVSSRHLASWLGTPPRGFCYPNGDYDERVFRRSGARATPRVYDTSGSEPALSGFLRLLRIDMNPRRVLRSGRHDEMAMRAEISLLHKALR